jgi:hypothetical protein
MFIIAAVLYLSLVFAAGIKEITNYTIPFTELGGFQWGPDGSMLFFNDHPDGAEVRYVPPSFPPNPVYTRTLSMEGADHVWFIPSLENADVFAVEAKWGGDHTIYGYKTGKKIVNTGEIQWHDGEIEGYQYATWAGDNFVYMALTETLGTVHVQMYNNKFKLKTDALFECNSNNYGVPPVWLSPHGRYVGIDQLPTVSATLDVDIYRIGRKPRLMGQLQTKGGLHFDGKKDNFIYFILPTSPTEAFLEVDRIGSLKKLAKINMSKVSSYLLNTKGKGSFGYVDTNNMLYISSEKGVYGPFTIPEAQAGDKIFIAHYYGSDMILLFNQPGNIRFYAYKVSKKGLKKKAGPETYSLLAWQTRTDKYLIVAYHNGTAYDTTIYTTKLKKVGSLFMNTAAKPKRRSMIDVKSDGTNTEFTIYKW